jgi:putative membrane protein
MDTQTFTEAASPSADETASSDGAARRRVAARGNFFTLGQTITSSALLTAAIMAVCLSGPVSAQTAETGSLSPVDYAFIGQTNLGNGFQIDSGKLGETRAASPAVRDYATLMDTSHVEVENNLKALLTKLNVQPPPTSLLAGAYHSLVALLARERGAAFDRDYVNGQLDYQKGNDALYRWEIQNGSNEELKAYARATLPKIDDHWQRAKALAAAQSSKHAGSAQ